MIQPSRLLQKLRVISAYAVLGAIAAAIVFLVGDVSGQVDTVTRTGGDPRLVSYQPLPQWQKGESCSLGPLSAAL